jgi:uncharacterized protein (TIGR02118 family)
VIKTVFTWRDNPDLTGQQCEAHYRDVHMTLARECFDGVDGFIALVFNRVRSHSVNDFNHPRAIAAPSDVDAYCELWFNDEASMRRAFEKPHMRRMFEDHANFMDTARPANIHIYDVEETIVLRGADSTRWRGGA